MALRERVARRHRGAYQRLCRFELFQVRPMAKVLMRCPVKGDENSGEFDTGLDIPRKQGLASIGGAMISCPICGEYHYIRKAYFLGDDPGIQRYEGLEGAPAYAIEIGIILGMASFMEVYVPQIYSKLSGMDSSSGVVFGAISSISQKIGVLEAYLPLLKDNRKADFKALSVLIKKLRECASIRDFYAHAKYNRGGYPDSISMLPFFGDSRKKAHAISLTLERARSDAETILNNKFMIREYIISKSPPNS